MKIVGCSEIPHSYRNPAPSVKTYDYRGNKDLLPIGEKTKASLRFFPVSPHRRALIVRALRPFASLPVSRSVRIELSGPFPRNATARSYEVYLWRVSAAAGTFIPREEYPELESHTTIIRGAGIN